MPINNNSIDLNNGKHNVPRLTMQWNIFSFNHYLSCLTQGSKNQLFPSWNYAYPAMFNVQDQTSKTTLIKHTCNS